MLALSIRDLGILHAYYMPFIRNGGLFIPTQRAYNLGDEVFVLLQLMNESERIPVVGKIILLMPHQADHQRSQGVGIQFDEDEGQLIRARIETYLAGYDGGAQATQTF